MAPSRALGRSGVEISRVVFGCMEVTQTDESARIRTLHAAFDAGITAFDTAPMYGFGASEELLARAIADRRDRVQVLTKVGLRWDSHHGQVLFESGPPGPRRVVRRDSRPDSIRQEVTRSLRRLGIETIALVQVHHRDQGTPVAETCAALAALQREGKIRAIGVSNFDAGDVREAARALAVEGSALDALQLEYNLADRRAEARILPAASERGVSVLAYSPLAQGLLAGRQLGGAAMPGDGRRESTYYREWNVSLANTALERVLLPIARARGASAAQVALAWLLGQAAVTAVVVGARDAVQAVANAGAAQLELTPDEKRALAHAFTGMDLRPTRGGGLREVLRRVARVAAAAVRAR